jgi:hypothetical protein
MIVVDVTVFIRNLTFKQKQVLNLRKQLFKSKH